MGVRDAGGSGREQGTHKTGKKPDCVRTVKPYPYEFVAWPRAAPAKHRSDHDPQPVSAQVPRPWSRHTTPQSICQQPYRLKLASPCGYRGWLPGFLSTPRIRTRTRLHISKVKSQPQIRKQLAPAAAEGPPILMAGGSLKAAAFHSIRSRAAELQNNSALPSWYFQGRGGCVSRLASLFRHRADAALYAKHFEV
jgi:hypothetical protein